MLPLNHQTYWIESSRWVEMTGFTFPWGRNKLRVFIKKYEADSWETQMKLHARLYVRLKRDKSAARWNIKKTRVEETGKSNSMKCPYNKFVWYVQIVMEYKRNGLCLDVVFNKKNGNVNCGSIFQNKLNCLFFWLNLNYN